MQSQARAVVIGGGVVGCSILYHLTEAGWRDAVLLERDELTAGSTWHAAGLLPLFNMSYAVGQIHRYSIDLYTKLAEAWQRDVGFRRVGNLRMARTRARMEEFQTYASTADAIGIAYEWWSPDEIKRRFPLVNVEGLVGALFHPTDGYINPADITLLLADAARKGGAQIHRQTDVTAIDRLASGEWRVTTNQGAITCEVVVCATGNHARRTAAMLGLEIPAIPVEHQYIVTDEIPEIVAWRRAGNPEHPILRDADARWYMREERGGLILGPYEKGAPAWAAYGVPEGFKAELLPPDLERLEWHIEEALFRMPCFGQGGVKTVYNGPISYTPDGNPLLGPAPGRRGVYLAEGFSFGVTAAGGAGRLPGADDYRGRGGDRHARDRPAPLRPAGRRGPMRSRRTKKPTRMSSCRTSPTRSAPAARPLRTAPSHDRLRARGAVFGQRVGWERPNFFGPGGGFAEGMEFPPQQLVAVCPRGGGGGAQWRGPDRGRHLRQIPGARSRRRGVAGRAGRKPAAAEGGPHPALPRAHAARRRAQRVHDHARRPRRLLHRRRRCRGGVRLGLPHAHLAARPLSRAGTHHHPDRRVRARRPARARRAGAAGRPARSRQRRVPLAHRPARHGRDGAGAADAGELCR